MNIALNACPKSKSLYNKPQEPSQRQMGEISDKVRKEVNNRTTLAPIGCCEGCLKNRNGYMRLELAHVEGRKQISHKTTANDLLRLCGPSTDSRTCHGFAHSGEKGKAWMEDLQERLITNVDTHL